MCFDQQKLLIVMKSILSTFFSYGQCFSKKSLPTPGCQSFGYFFFPGKFLMLALMFPSMVYLNLPFVHGVKKLVGGAKGDQGLFFLYFILDFPPALLVQKTIVSTH